MQRCMAPLLSCELLHPSVCSSPLAVRHAGHRQASMLLLPVVPCRAGCYCLQYSLKPELPSGRTLRFSIDLEVAAGPPVGFDIQVRNCPV